MIHLIPYGYYQFNPKLIDRKKYEALKETFTENPELEFPNPDSYRKVYPNETRAFYIMLGIIMILVPFGEIIDGTIFMAILGMTGVAFVIFSITSWSQYFSFQKSRRRQIKYQKNLKKCILESSSYESFKKNMQTV